MEASDKEIVRRVKETTEFLKVESVGDMWNTPQLIEMLEDLLKGRFQDLQKRLLIMPSSCLRVTVLTEFFITVSCTKIAMTRIRETITSKNAKTFFFAGIIAAMILPFSVMDFAVAEEKPDIKDVTLGKTNVKNEVSFKAMPTIDDVKENLKKEGYSEAQISSMDMEQKHFEKHQQWLSDHRDTKKEQITREKQTILTDHVIENLQSDYPSQNNYLPWTSIGYDYEDNALEITIEPNEFTSNNIQKYESVVRTIIGNEIDITISPMDLNLQQISCYNRSNCSDMKAGVKILVPAKNNMWCAMGFAATYKGQSGFVTAGHCFDAAPIGTDVFHNRAHIGDLVRETVTSSNKGARCDCAFVNSTLNYSASDSTYGMSDATKTGSSTNTKQIKASLSKSNKVSTGVILDENRSYNYAVGGYYYYKYVVVTDINVKSGDSGSPVFSSNGDELLGFMVAIDLNGDSLYVKHNKFTTYFRGLTWDF